MRPNVAKKTFLNFSFNYLSFYLQFSVANYEIKLRWWWLKNSSHSSNVEKVLFLYLKLSSFSIIAKFYFSRHLFLSCENCRPPMRWFCNLNQKSLGAIIKATTKHTQPPWKKLFNGTAFSTKLKMTRLKIAKNFWLCTFSTEKKVSLVEKISPEDKYLNDVRCKKFIIFSKIN